MDNKHIEVLKEMKRYVEAQKNYLFDIDVMHSTDYDNKIKALQASITALEWISVDDRLPKDKKNYIVNEMLNNESTISIARYTEGEDEMIWLDEYNSDIIVTHWKPLPEPPERTE